MTVADQPPDQYEALIDAFPDAVFIHDREGVILLANHRASQNLGYDRDYLVGKTIWAFAEEPDPTSVKPRWDALSAGATERFTGCHERRDGSTFPIEAHVTKLTQRGEARFLATVRDVTEQRERERALERKNDQLEDFARTLSHDLRNPLMVAKGHFELARETGSEEHYGTVEQALDRIDRLIEDLFTLARDGRTVEDLEPLCLSDLANRCWTNVETAEATIDIESELCLLAEESRLQQVLENLYRNAIEHGRSDVRITVGALENEAGFYVEDDGPGIPSAERDRVFEGGYSTQDHGTGFGLKIVKEIAEAHGWDIAITAGSAGGARFEFVDVETA